MVSSDGVIEDLTVKIKEKSHLASIDPSELCVWKLHKPRPSKEVVRTGFLTTVKVLHELSEDEARTRPLLGSSIRSTEFRLRDRGQRVISMSW
jgi:hypothetical protein